MFHILFPEVTHCINQFRSLITESAGNGLVASIAPTPGVTVRTFGSYDFMYVAVAATLFILAGAS